MNARVLQHAVKCILTISAPAGRAHQTVKDQDGYKS
jgi:hypothetical protein